MAEALDTYFFFRQHNVILKYIHPEHDDANHGAQTKRWANSSAGEPPSAPAHPATRVDQAPGTLDGGDVCQAENHFFVGLSERTNEAGGQQLAELLAQFGYTSSFVDIRKIGRLLHLKSGLAYLGDNRLIVTEALGHEAFPDYELIHVSSNEEYAANCIRVNDHVLLASGYQSFAQRLKELGYQIIALEMSEFQKMDGGLSCLSLRF